MKKLVLFFALTIPLAVSAQNPTLISKLDELKSQLGKVENEKKIFEQELVYEKAYPYNIEILTKETDSKGKTVERKALVNLGLLDKRLVKREVSKNLMWVSVKSGGTPVIKTFNNGTQSDFINQLEIYSDGVDNARAIEELIKTIIPIAENEWKSSVALPSSFNGLQEWLAKNINNVEAGETIYTQSLVFEEENPSQAWLEIEESPVKGGKKNERYGFNLADLHEPSVAMKVRKNKITIEAAIANNQNFVSIEENGSFKGYTKNISIYTEDASQAQVLTLALKELIPFARKESEKTLPKPASQKEAIVTLAELTKSFQVNDNSFDQSLTQSQQCTYTLKSTSSKGSTEEAYSFDFSDLNVSSISITATRQQIFVEVSTRDNQLLIETFKNGELQNYSKQLKFLVPDVNTARKFQHVLNYVALNSTSTVVPKDYDWLKNTVSGFDEQKLEISQLLDLQEGEQCKLAFTTRKETNKKVDEHLYEFNLYDIDASKMALNIKGKTVAVALPASRGESIIKDYDNGGKVVYSKQVSVIVPDIETGKTIMATFQKLAGDCSGK